MEYTWENTGGPEWTFRVGDIWLVLSTDEERGLPEHTRIIETLNESVDNQQRLAQLLVFNHNFAYTIYCLEKGIVTAPNPTSKTTT